MKYLYILIVIWLGLLVNLPAFALPDNNDLPEEVLRTEIILEGRSPFDGEPLNLAEYVELQQQISQSEFPPNLSSEVRHTIFLLELLKFLRTFTPL